MEKLNRDLQRALLTRLGEQYPRQCDPSELGFDGDEPEWIVNILYLSEHGLVDSTSDEMLGRGHRVHLAGITAKGLDFLQDDGGLGAILNVVTVRLEAETLKAIIGERIDGSALPDPEKRKLRRWLDTAGSEALKDATKRLVGAALDHAPGAFQLLQAIAA